MSDGASLMRAVEGGDIEELRELLAQGSSPNEADPYGATALHWAAFRGQTDICALLLERGADPNAASNGGRTPLHLAAQGGSTDVIDLLVAHRADVGAMDRAESRTPLHMAVQEGHCEAASLLIGCGADVNQQDGFGQTPLWLAAQSGHTEMVQSLLALGADMNIASQQEVSPLLAALQEGHVEIAQGLIGMGADVRRAEQEEGLTALHAAARNGLTDLVRLLLAQGADASARTKDGSTAEDMAVAAGHPDVAAEIRQHATGAPDLAPTNGPTSSTVRQVQLPEEDEFAAPPPDEVAAPEEDAEASPWAEAQTAGSVGDAAAHRDAVVPATERPREPPARRRKPQRRHLLAVGAIIALAVVAGFVLFFLPHQQDERAKSATEKPASPHFVTVVVSSVQRGLAGVLRVGGEWTTVARDKLQGLRLRRSSQPPESPAAGSERAEASPPQPKLFTLKDSINDFAGVLDSRTIDHLREIVRRARKKAGVEFAVVTVESTQPFSAAEYAARLLEQPGSNAAIREKGAVFVAAVRDGQAAVIAAPSISGPLWRIRSIEIIGEEVVPRLRRGDYANAVGMGTDQLTSVLTLESTLTVVRGRRKAAEVARNTMTVTIRSNPSGAAVVLDGESATKTTPFVALLTRGEHQVEVSKPGYRSRNATITVEAKPTEHVFDLEALE